MNLVLVEDNEGLRSHWLKLLARLPGLKVVGVAGSALSAVETVLATRPDVVLMDLHLGDDNGLDALIRLREARCGALILLMSTQIEPALRAQAIALGADGVYDKASEIDAILGRLRGDLLVRPDDEEARLATLTELGLLDASPLEELDGIARLAAEIADTPVALVTLVDRERVFFLSRVGTELREISRSTFFCNHAIGAETLLVVPDACQDERFATSVAVRGEMGASFYAGAPLRLSNGVAVGNLCVIDRRLRALSEAQQRGVLVLGRAVAKTLELRRCERRLDGETRHRQRAERDLRALALRDPLTELPNRAGLNEQFSRLQRTARGSRRQITVLVVQVDRLDEITRNLGLEVSDRFVTTLGQRFAAAVRSGDMIGRVSCDRFAIIMDAPIQGSVALSEAIRIRSEVTRAVDVDGLRLHPSLSLGVAVSPQHGESLSSLLRCGERAASRASVAGGPRVELYAPEQTGLSQERFQLEGELREAIDTDQLCLYYQPIVDLQGQCLCIEALARWHHPRRGVILPDQFIPLAEERGLIESIGHVLLHRCLAQIVAWKRQGLAVPRVSLNVSAHQLHGQFDAILLSALARHGLSPSHLELEVTESALCLHGEQTALILSRLRKAGVSVAIDDFGVGYSSLARLRKMPLDRLKIDQSFARELPTSGTGQALVLAIIAMARALGLETVAEGVENEAQWRVMRELGCTGMQGRWLGAELPAESMEDWLRLRAGKPPAAEADAGAERMPG
ncbi:MAG: EAL domain-containing protein [Rhodocyclaceae bacterium]|nr:EAL domain-containing protein [Rhodocyclaceae bacterium]